MSSYAVRPICLSNSLFKKPVQNTQVPAQSAYSECPKSDITTNRGTPDSPAVHLVVSKDRRSGYYLETPDFQERAEKARTLAMQERPDQFKLLPLSEAAPKWLKEKTLHAGKPRTVEAYQLYIDNLIRLLGAEKLCSLHIGSIITYQQTRMAEKTRTGNPPCASYVNHETNTLAQILKRADLWDLIEKHYRPLPTGNWTPPKVLSEEQEELFFRVAASNPDWCVAYWAVSITNNTSAHGTELRNLQLKHVFLDHVPPKVHIPDSKVKNEFRARVIPLNEVAEKQMRRIVARARAKGAGLPEHYIFPFRVNRGAWDVTRPASRAFIKKAFAAMREATGLDWLQPRNFRNQVITKLFESGAPDETITSIAGHQSIRMSQFYSRIRIDRKFEALSAIMPKKKGVQNAG